MGQLQAWLWRGIRGALDWYGVYNTLIIIKVFVFVRRISFKKEFKRGINHCYNFSFGSNVFFVFGEMLYFEVELEFLFVVFLEFLDLFLDHSWIP